MTPAKRLKQAPTLIPGGLTTRGYMVIDCGEDLMRSFDSAVFFSEMREFVNPLGQRNAGAFGAYGNASSFHQPQMRRLRSGLYAKMKPILKGIYGDGWFVQFLIDRLSERLPGTSLSGDIFHRDATIDYSAGPDESTVVVLGGFFNMSLTETQFLSCVPGTQNEPNPDGGFSKRMSKLDAATFKPRSEIVEVPPNSLILYNELLIHEDQAFKRPLDLPSCLRLYIKCHLSRTGVPAYPMSEIIETIRTQGVPRLNLKDKYAPMYGSSLMRFHKKKVLEFSQNVKPNFRGADGFVKRKMDSLYDAGEELFLDYTADEIADLTPNVL